MGFRKHRRGGRHGGGGGGGGGHGHGHHQQQHFGYNGTGEANGLQPGDDVGNRRSFKVVQLPPEDLGNRKDPEESEWVPEDNVGNRIDAAPTHELSGVLLDLDGKRRRRRPKGVAAPERVGRYFIGGVNPLIATTTPRPFPGKTLEESMNGSQGAGPGPEVLPSDVSDAVAGGDEAFGDGPDQGGGEGFEGEGGEGRGRRRRRRGRGRDQVDGVQAQEVSERRAQRFFDFEEDDRFDYTLKTTAEQKRKEAEDAVRSIVVESGRDATVLARLIEDGTRPKVLVTIEERGPAASLPAERRAQNAAEPLFVMGNAALMSLNYLVNKIVNRYPDDRIRLAILPAADERLYLDALADHQKVRRAPGVPAQAPVPVPVPVPVPAPAPVVVTAPVVPVAATVAAAVVAAPVVAPPVIEAVVEHVVEAVVEHVVEEPEAKKPARPRKAAPKADKPEKAEKPEKAAKTAEKPEPKKPLRPRVGTRKAPEIERVVIAKKP